MRSFFRERNEVGSQIQKTFSWLRSFFQNWNVAGPCSTFRTGTRNKRNFYRVLKFPALFSKRNRREKSAVKSETLKKSLTRQLFYLFFPSNNALLSDNCIIFWQSYWDYTSMSCLTGKKICEYPKFCVLSKISAFAFHFDISCTLEKKGPISSSFWSNWVKKTLLLYQTCKSAPDTEIFMILWTRFNITDLQSCQICFIS